MKRRKITIAGVVLLTVLLLCYLNRLLAPTWRTWNNDNTIKGIYQEPKDRIQVLFLGTSQVVTGISPIYLYEKYGICSYNLGTEQQPLLSSYYLLKEINRLHDKTLSVVVLNLSYVFLEESEDEKIAFNEKALMNLRLSPVKIEALRALAEQYDDVDFAEYFFPVIRYHSRWASINSNDFIGMSTAENRFFTRGHHLLFTRAQNNIPGDYLLVPDYSITAEIDHTKEEIESSYTDLNKEYLDRIVDYCRDNDIELVFMRAPKRSDDLQHDAVAYLAEQYGVPLIDFNEVAVQEEINFSFPIDFVDSTHPNIWGAEKITEYIGEYISLNYSLDDVREDGRYDYLKAQRDEYKIIEEDKALAECDDLLEYLDLINNERYIAFMAVKDEAYSRLPNTVIEKMESLGFIHFAEMGFRRPYIGVIDSGEVIVDECSADITTVISQEGSFSRSGRFSISSSGFSGSNLASININGEEYSQNMRGLNIVVYDKYIDRVIDTTCFDTFSNGSRYDDTEPTKEYLLKVDSARIDAASGIRDYIDVSMDDSHFLVICGNITDSVSQTIREAAKAVEEYGAAEITDADKGAYICVVEDGSILADNVIELGDDTYAFTVEGIRIEMFYSPKHSLVLGINGRDYYVPEDEVLLLVYNKELNAVVSTRS